MPTTLICTLGKLENYKPAQYRFGDDVLGEATVPATVLARHFRPERIVLLCPGESPETARWFAEELEPLGFPQPEVRVLPVLHSADDVPELLHALGKVLAEETARGADLHLDFSFGLRSITVLALLASDFLASVSHARVVRLTCINFEMPRDAGVSEILDLTSYLHLSRLRVAAEALESRGDFLLLAEAIAAAFPGELNEDDVRNAREMSRRLALLRTRQATSKSGGRLLVRRLRRAVSNAASRIPVLQPIALRVEAHLAPLDPGERHSASPYAIARLARWYLDHNQPSLAVILCIEASERWEDAPRIDTHIAALFGAFYRRRKGIRHTIAHADLSATRGAGQIEELDIAECVAEFETLCAQAEAAHANGSIDALLP